MRLVSYRMRFSVRWIINFKHACKRWIGLPFINNSGVMSPTALRVWRCHPLQALGSIIATIYNRITTQMIKRHDSRYAFSLQRAILSVASVYAITNDNYVLNRFYGIYRRTAKSKRLTSGPILRIVSKIVRNMDVDQRFVYNQVCSQAHWFQHRSERPCDKSRRTQFEIPGILESFSIDEKVPKCPCNDYSCFYGGLCTSDFPRCNEYSVRPELPQPRKAEVRVRTKAIGNNRPLLRKNR